jgi:uncharacterized membrane protein
MPADPTPLPDTARQNLELITRAERELHRRRSPAERAADAVARFFGSPWFLAVHTLALGGWILLNVGLLPVTPFDPYPFPLLGLIVGVEFIYLTAFVLMNQRREEGRFTRWTHLALQVSLLTEREATKTVQMLRAVCDRLGVEHPPADREAEELARETPLTELLAEVERASDGKAGG